MVVDIGVYLLKIVVASILRGGGTKGKRLVKIVKIGIASKNTETDS